VTPARIYEVVQWAEQKHHVGRRRFFCQVARVTDDARDQWPASLFVTSPSNRDEARRHIDETDAIAQLCEPEGVCSRRPTDIKNARWRWRGMPKY
jgi:hypothetical protein